MAKNTNLLLNVASLSMKIAGRCLIPYGHPKSPHKFTQRQLMTCLVLRAYTKNTYRGIIELLETSGQLRRILYMERLPHYSTLKKFADRTVIPEILEFMLGEILREVGDNSDEVAMDSTGLETSSASAHYVSRRGRDRKQYVKVSASVTCKSMLAAGLAVSWGPGNDKAEAPWLLTATAEKLRPRYLYADAGYDAEWVHRYCREKWGVRSYIPPAVHCRDGSVNGRYRSQMTRLPKRYGRRWHVESFFSGLNRIPLQLRRMAIPPPCGGTKAICTSVNLDFLVRRVLTSAKGLMIEIQPVFLVLIGPETGVKVKSPLDAGSGVLGRVFLGMRDLSDQHILHDDSLLLCSAG